METTQPVSERVVVAVATATNTDPVELPCLYGVIEPDALNTVVRTMTGGEIHFQYAGHAVTVKSDGTVHVDGEPMRRPKQANLAADD